MTNFEIKQAIREDREEFFNENIKPVLVGAGIGLVICIGIKIVCSLLKINSESNETNNTSEIE